MKTSQRLLLQSKCAWQLVISETVLRQLYEFRQTDAQSPEAGGTFLGQLLVDDGTGLIETLTIPGKGDRCSRRSFFRSARHQREVLNYWKNTGQTGTYLGLWHTHPEPIPTPSTVDLTDWKRTIARGIYPGRGLLFAIAGIDGVGFWMGMKITGIESLGYWKWELGNV